MNEQFHFHNQEEFPTLDDAELQAVNNARSAIAEWRDTEAESGMAYAERLTGVTSDGRFVSIDERSEPLSYSEPESGKQRFVVRTAEIGGLAAGGTAIEERLDEGGMSVMRFRGAATRVVLRTGQGNIEIPSDDSGKAPSINGQRIFRLPPIQTDSEQPRSDVEADPAPSTDVAPRQVAGRGLLRWHRNN